MTLNCVEAGNERTAVDAGYIEGQIRNAERFSYQYVPSSDLFLDFFVRIAEDSVRKLRLRRRTGYNGLRVGEAKNPGPESESGQLAVLISLVQLLIQMVAKLTGGDTDMAGMVAKANTTMDALAAPRPNLEEGSATRRVTFSEDDGGEAWQQAGSKRKRKSQNSTTGKGSGDPVTGGQSSGQSAPGRGGGKPSGEKGKGKSKQHPDPEGSSKGGKPASKLAEKTTSAPHAEGEWRLRPEDWNGKIVTLEELAEYKGQGESLLLVAKDKEEAEVVSVMANSGSIKSSLLVVWRDDKGNLQLPFWQGGRAALLKVYAEKFPVAATALPMLKGERQKVRQLTAKPTVVLRLALIKNMAMEDDWRQANEGLRKFVLARAPQIKDMWGGATEAKRGPSLVALVRVAEDQAMILLQRSGVGGLFWEPLARKIGSTTFAVKWFDKDDQETEIDYLQRGLLKKPALGLVVGRRQLGERVDQANAVVIRSWRLPNTPQEWTQDTVEEILQDSGLTEIAINSRMTRNSKVTWFLRAACKEDVIALPVVENGKQKHYFVLPSTPSRRGPAKRTPLPHEGAFIFNSEQFKIVPKSAAPPPAAPKEGEKEESATKRQAVSQRAPPEGTKIETMDKDGNCLPAAIAAAIAWHKDTQKPRSSLQLRAEIIAYMTRKADLFAGFWDGRDTKDKEGALKTFSDYLKEAARNGSYLGHLEIEAACRLFNLTIYVIPDAANLAPTRHGTGAFPVALRFEQGAGDIGHYDLLLPAHKDKGYPAVVTNIQEIGEPKGGRGGGTNEPSEAAWTIYTVNSAGEHVPAGRMRGIEREQVDSASAAGSKTSKLSGLKRSSQSNVEAFLAKKHRQAARGQEDSTEMAHHQEASSSNQQEAPLPNDIVHPGKLNLVQAFQRGRVRSDVVAEGPPTVRDEEASADSQDLDNVPLPQPQQKRVKGGPRPPWSCQFCAYTTPRGREVAGARAMHLNKWHPELKAQWSSRGAYDIQWANYEGQDREEFAWTCAFCNMGILKANHRGQHVADALLRARRAHTQAMHPEAEGSHKLPSSDNSKKATIGKVAAAVSRRLIKTKTGLAEHHQVETFRIPFYGNYARHKRATSTIFICTKCTAASPTLKALHDARCDTKRPPSGAARQRWVSKLEETVANPQRHAANLVEGAKSVLAIVRHGPAAAPVAGEPVDEDSRHRSPDVLPWPQRNGSQNGEANFNWGLAFVCRWCGSITSSTRKLRQMPCQRAHKRRRNREISKLKRLLEGPKLVNQAARNLLAFFEVDPDKENTDEAPDEIQGLQGDDAAGGKDEPRHD